MGKSPQPIWYLLSFLVVGTSGSLIYALVKEEQLDADKLRQVIDRYVYTGKKPLPDPDIVQLITRPLKLAERGPTRKRVYDRVLNYVETFSLDIAA